MKIKKADTKEFCKLVVKHTGIVVDCEHNNDVSDVLAKRIKETGSRSWKVYRHLLQNGNKECKIEWEHLAVSLTVGESYFFRDSGQFDVISTELLPLIIDRNRKSKRIKIWSAGCSTGEETYSLAMTLDGVLPARDGWDIDIIGTDINRDFLSRARKGRYSEWSFRMADDVTRAIYFKKKNDEWQVSEEIRSMARFQLLNLIDDKYPDIVSGISDFDLILCRNVFIYFEQKTVIQVVRKLIQCLSPNGFLITGHAEVRTRMINNVKLRRFAD